MNIETLQERIEHKAYLQAKSEVEAFWNKAPYYDNITLARNETSTKYESYYVNSEIAKKMIERRKLQLVDEYSRKVLDTIDQLEDITGAIEDLQSRS